MKTTKLVVGILEIVLALVILLQSRAVGVGHAMENNNDDVGGSAGFLCAILFIATGIVYIATRKSEKMGGDIAGLIMMLLVWLLGLANSHDYGDLAIWAWLAFIIGVGFFVWHMVIRKREQKSDK